SFHRSAHGEEVVLANENDRQLVKRSQIERFVERTLVNRAIAKKTKRDAIFISIFAREGQSRGERDVRADDGMSAVHVVAAIEKMHGSAETARATGFLAEQLGHTRISARSARERMSVIAISGNDVVVTTRSGNRAADDCFLANVKMAEAADLLGL